MSATSKPYSWEPTGILVNPDCIAGKHANCDGGWDVERDEPTGCPCHCHDNNPSTKETDQ